MIHSSKCSHITEDYRREELGIEVQVGSHISTLHSRNGFIFSLLLFGHLFFYTGCYALVKNFLGSETEKQDIYIYI